MPATPAQFLDGPASPRRPSEPDQPRGCLGPLLVIALVALVAFNFETLAVRFFDYASLERDPLRRDEPGDVYRYLTEQVKDDRLRVLLRCIHAGMHEYAVTHVQFSGEALGLIRVRFPFGYTSRRLTATERRTILERMHREAGDDSVTLRSVPRTEETTAEWEPERQQFLQRVHHAFGNKPLAEVKRDDFVSFFASEPSWQRAPHGRENYRFREHARFAYDKLHACLHDVRLAC